MIIEKVKEYIKAEGLDSPSREQVLRYKRHYICYRLKRYSRFKLYEIGNLFNEASCYGIKFNQGAS
jgi:hypothetical protein